MNNLSVERLTEIEQEREKTQNDPKFQKWMRQLNVSRMYVDRSGIIQAKDIMNQYDYSKHTYNVKIS